MKKRLVSLFILLFSISNFALFNISNAWAPIKPGTEVYYNYDITKPLLISGVFNSKIDKLLNKTPNDYYKQYQLLIAINNKIKSLALKSPSKQEVFNELQNYIMLKISLLYWLSQISDEKAINDIKNDFKQTIEKKGSSIQSVLTVIFEKYVWIISIENNPWQPNKLELQKIDFSNQELNTIQNNLLQEAEKNKQTLEEINNNSKEITLEDFNKIAKFLPTEIKFEKKDNFWNIITSNWTIEDTFLWYAITDELKTFINSKIDAFSNMKKEELNNELAFWVWNLNQLFWDENISYNFLYNIKKVGNVSKDATITAKEIKNSQTQKVKWYYITITNNENIFSYWAVNKKKIIIYVFNTGSGVKYYLYPWLYDIIYLGDNKSKQGLYLYVDYIDNKTSFIVKWVKAFTDDEEYIQTNSNVNIVFEDWKTLSSKNKTITHSLRDLKDILNKKITQINIDWKDMTSWLLIDKWSIINLYK